MDLAAEYEKAKVASDKATEASTLNYTKKRSIAGEFKHYKEQKEEVERWEALKVEQVRTMARVMRNWVLICTADLQEELVSEFMLWKLFHIFAEIETCENKIAEAEGKVEDLKAAQVCL